MAVEIEIKLKIDLRDLVKLRQVLPIIEAEKELKNLYFDSPDRSLRQKKIMVRMRTRACTEGAVLCVKGRSENKDGIFRAEENEWILSQEETTQFQAEPASQAPRLDALLPFKLAGKLAPFGSIHVRREVYEIASGLFLELDHVRYSDGSEDAEMEMEAPEERLSEARGLLEQLLRSAGVEACSQDKTKYQRFLERI